MDRSRDYLMCLRAMDGPFLRLCQAAWASDLNSDEVWQDLAESLGSTMDRLATKICDQTDATQADLWPGAGAEDEDGELW